MTVVESNRVGSGASFANGGWLCPAQAGPLPEPGLTLYGMRSLFDRDSALYFKPGDWNRLAPWLLRFWTYCNERDHAHGTAAIARLGHDVFDLIEEMRADGVEFELHKQGMVYAAQQRRRRARRAAQARADARARLRAARRRHHRRRAARARAGAVPEGDRRASRSASTGTCGRTRSRPGSPTCCAATASRSRRAPRSSSSCARGRRLTHVRTAAGDIEADMVVLAAGAWTTPLARSIGISLPMEPGKGYSFSVRPTVVPSHAILLGRRARRLHAVRRPHPHRRHDGVQRHQQPPRSPQDRLDRRRCARRRSCPGRPPRSSRSGRACARSRPTACRSSIAPVRSTTPTSPRATPCRASRSRRPSGRALAEMIATGERPALLEPFRLDRFHRVPLPRAARRRNGSHARA